MGSSFLVTLVPPISIMFFKVNLTQLYIVTLIFPINMWLNKKKKKIDYTITDRNLT